MLKDEIDAAYGRISGVVRETPLEESALAPGVFLKLEHLQHTGSFKFRGASNKIAMLESGYGPAWRCGGRRDRAAERRI